MIPVVDSHVRLWTPGTPGAEWLARAPVSLNRTVALADYVAGSRPVPLRAVVFVEAAAARETTVELLRVARESAVPAVVVGWLDLASLELARDIAAVRAGAGGDSLVGVRWSRPSGRDGGRWLVTDRMRAAARVLADHGLTLDLLVTRSELGAAAGLADAHPALTFVIDHLGGAASDADGTENAWREGMARLADRPNVVVKLSGITGDRRSDGSPMSALVGRTIDLFGFERMMYGSDWPVSTQFGDYGETLALTERLVGSAPGPGLASLFSETALRVYGIAA